MYHLAADPCGYSIRSPVTARFFCVSYADPRVICTMLIGDGNQSDCHDYDFWVLPVTPGTVPLRIYRTSQWKSMPHPLKPQGVKDNYICIFPPSFEKLTRSKIYDGTDSNTPGIHGYSFFSNGWQLTFVWSDAARISGFPLEGTRFVLRVRYWGIVTILVIPLTWLIYSQLKTHARKAAHLCPTCSYDLRAHLANSPSPAPSPNTQNSGLIPQDSPLPPRCPECGTLGIGM